MKIAILWSTMTSAMAAGFKAFSKIYNAELLVIAQPPDPNAPYSHDEFTGIKNIVLYKDGADFQRLKRMVTAFQPDAVLMCSWNFRDYMRLTRTHPLNKLPRVASADNQWHGTMKQHLGVMVSPFFLKPSIDCFFVSGERQVEFCRKLGYDYDRVVTGYCSCDLPRFASVHETRKKGVAAKAFLFVGRMVPEKGVLDLIEAYKLYRKKVSDPYPLICAGKGPLSDDLKAVSGVEVKDFVQPADMPAIFVQATCFILPSTFEPWGIVIHEAAATGQAIICTRSCGAAVHLVQDGYNGFIVRTGRPGELADAMIEYTLKSDAERHVMSQRSHVLSQQYSPELWAHALKKAFQKAKARHREK